MRKVTVEVTRLTTIEIDEGTTTSDAVSELEVIGSDTVGIVDSEVIKLQTKSKGIF